MFKRTAFALFCMIFLAACGNNADPSPSPTSSNLTRYEPATATSTHTVLLIPTPTQFTPTPSSSETSGIPNTQEPFLSNAMNGQYILLSNGEGSYLLVSMEGEIIHIIEKTSGTEAIVIDKNIIQMAGKRLMISSLTNDEIVQGPRMDCSGYWSATFIQDDYLISCEFENQVNFINSTGELVLVHPDPGLGDIYYLRQAFSPDGRYLAIWYITVEFSQTPDSGVIISDVECLLRNDSQDCITGPYLRGADPGYITWSPTSRKLAVSPDGGNNGEIIILDIATGETNQVLHLYTKIRSLQWAPAGDYIAYSKIYSSDNGIYLLDPQGGDPILIMETPNNYYSVVGWVDIE